MFVGSVSTTEAVNIFNISSYAAAKWKTVLTQDLSSFRVGATVGQWRNTNTVTSITLICPDATGFAAGSTFTLYGIAAA
jgi:hypothetical protein